MRSWWWSWTAVDNATGYKVQWKSGVEGFNTGNRQAVIGSGTTTSRTEQRDGVHGAGERDADGGERGPGVGR